MTCFALDCRADLPSLPSARCPLCADRPDHARRALRRLPERSPISTGPSLPSPTIFRSTALFHVLKYGHQLAVANWCAQQLAPRVDPAPLWIASFPALHPERSRQRGFNQSGEIAKRLARASGLPIAHQIACCARARQRRRPTCRTSGATTCAARLNAADFSAKRLLLIDDVMTTGRHRQRMRARAETARRPGGHRGGRRPRL